MEINIDGTDYIFDPDMQAVAAGWKGDDRFYMRDDSFRGQYGYSRGESAPAGVGESVDSAEEVTEKP